jgi:hypothetical protein
VSSARAELVQAATRSVVELARELGLDGVEPHVLAHSNHIVVELRPFAVVAKCGVHPRLRESSTSMAREVAVATVLAGDAPIVKPAAIVPAGPHRRGRFEVSFWELCPHPLVSESRELAAAAALREVHAALQRHRARLPELPEFDAVFEDAFALLSDREAMPLLADPDRTLLRDRLQWCRAEIAHRPGDRHPIHGECHAGQAFDSPAGVLWNDFEAVCLGPIEWDLTGLAAETRAVFAPFDDDLLRILEVARSVCVATWCWRDPDRNPEMREAAEYHLARVRELLP